MIHRPFSREELFEMAAEPIGNAAVMAEANDPAILKGAKKPSRGRDH